MKKYSDEIKSFIQENVQGTTTKDLALLVNKEFGTDFTESKMKAYKGNNGLKSGTPTSRPAGMPTELFPGKVRSYIKENHVGAGHQRMADQLNEIFGTNYTKEQIKAYYHNYGVNSGLTGRFQKGHKPVNAFKKGQHVSAHTEFKKGQRPQNYKPVGSERIRSDGYTEVKVADPNKWKMKHIIIWEDKNGPKPKGSAVLFGDGNRLNLELDNLILVSRKQLAVLNRKGLIQNSAELTRSGIMVANLYSKMTELKRSQRKTKAK